MRHSSPAILGTLNFLEQIVCIVLSLPALAALALAMLMDMGLVLLAIALVMLLSWFYALRAWLTHRAH